MPAPVVVAAAARTAGTGAARSVATKEAAKGAGAKTAAKSGGVTDKLQKAADVVPGLPRGKSKGSASKGSSGGFNAHRVLVMEFVICIIILGLFPLTKGEDDKLSPGAWMKKGSAVCSLFLLLGLLSSGGKTAAKVATAFGGIVTLTLLVNERTIFVRIAELFNKTNSEDEDPAEGDPEVDEDSAGAGGVGVGVGGAVTGPGVGIGGAAGQAAGNMADLLKVLKENQQRIYRAGMR
jgi:hypothetical protein